MRMALCSKTLAFSRQRIPPINTRLRFLTLLLFKFEYAATDKNRPTLSQPKPWSNDSAVVKMP